jgi:hypothetical protein
VVVVLVVEDIYCKQLVELVQVVELVVLQF